MFRPKGESRGLSGAWPARALALLLPVFASSFAVEAAEPNAASSVRNKIAQNSDSYFGPEERADELYLDALEKLDAGLSGPAGNILADLVAKYPTTKAATLARRRLSELGVGSARKADVMSTGAVPPAAPARGKPAATNVGRGPLWEQELRRNSSIQARLRMDAGDRVFFSAGSAELGSRAMSAIAAQAHWLNRWREFEAAIEGHADESESDQEDVKLSRERAEAVRRRLVLEGVAPGRLSIVAQGHTVPVAVCKAPECRAQNRRVVTLVFVGGTNKRLGLNAEPVAGTLGEVAAMPPADAQPMPDSLGTE